MRILVLDGNENQAVACVRSLARAGHIIRVGAPSSWSKAGWSRFSSGTFRYPAPEENADAFVQSVVKEIQGQKRTLVLPMTERSTIPISARREEITAAGGCVALPPNATVERAFDKYQTLRLAESLGIAVPQTQLVCDTFQAQRCVSTLRYPVVLKPRTSQEVTADGAVRSTGAPRYAQNAAQFLVVCDELLQRCSQVLAQEFIEGEGAGYFALMREGELRAEFAHRRIRDVRPTGSGSSLRESVAVQPQIREAGLAILHALSWTGVAMTEFRIRSDGVPVFMEVNGRFWNSLSLAIYAGVDFPALLAELAERGDVRPCLAYRTGVRCRWLLGDFRHLVEVWRGAPIGYAGKFPGRLRTLFSFLLPAPGTYHDNFTLGDPLPELGDWLDFAIRRVPGEWKKKNRQSKDLDAQRRYSHS